VWGDGLVGETTASGTTWGSRSSNVTPDHLVWGDLKALVGGSTALSWSNLEQANGDLLAKWTTTALCVQLQRCVAREQMIAVCRAMSTYTGAPS